MIRYLDRYVIMFIPDIRSDVFLKKVFGHHRASYAEQQYMAIFLRDRRL